MLVEGLHGAHQEGQVVGVAVFSDLLGRVEAGLAGGNVGPPSRRVVERGGERRGRGKPNVLDGIDGSFVSEQHAERLARAGERRIRGLERRLVRRDLLLRTHVVHAVAAPAEKTRVRDVDDVTLRDDREKSARHGDGRLTPQILGRDPRHVRVRRRVRPGGPLLRHDERHRQRDVRRDLVLACDDAAAELSIRIEPRVDGVARDRGHRRRARLAYERLGATYLFERDDHRRIARERPSQSFGEGDLRNDGGALYLGGGRRRLGARGQDDRKLERETSRCEKATRPIKHALDSPSSVERRARRPARCAWQSDRAQCRRTGPRTT